MSVAIEALSYRYPGTRAGIEAIDLSVGDGELLAVIGPSGCGKTTLLKLVAGFLAPDRGAIRLDGRDVTRLAPKDRHLGVVFQSYALFPHMSVAENVGYPLKLRGIGGPERQSRVGRMLELVGLAEFAARRPASLSGGQQQRVALARALVFEPAALLLDEPLSALDASLRIGMRDEIRRLQRDRGITALHVTHDQEEALSIADRVAVMGNGRLLQLAAPRTLYDHPADATVAAFVGQANLWPGQVVADGRVRVGLGELVCVTQGLAAGDRVTVLVRPERLAVVEAAQGPNSFTGRLARDRFLGAVRRFDLEIGGTVVLGETMSGQEIRAIHIPPQAVQLLPA